MDAELLLNAHATIGEQPTWVAAQGAVFWMDIKAPALHRLSLAGDATQSWALPSDIGAFALCAGEREAVVALRQGLARLDLATGVVSALAPPPFDPAHHRFNEGLCDAGGRWWLGTMFDPAPGVKVASYAGGLFRFSAATGLEAEPDGSELHNGMAWGDDSRVFFLSDSQKHTIFAFGYEAATGALSGRRVFATVPPEDGVPDGAAVDVEGGYWCALHGGWRLRRFHADGRFDRDIMPPCAPLRGRSSTCWW